MTGFPAIPATTDSKLIMVQRPAIKTLSQSGHLHIAASERFKDFIQHCDRNEMH